MNARVLGLLSTFIAVGALVAGCGGSSSKPSSAKAPSGGGKALDTKAIQQAFGGEGQMQKGGVFLVEHSRDELHARVRGVAIKPDFALDHEMYVLPMGSKAMVMGELTLKESEASRVLPRLLGRGIQVAALHNHLLGTQPELMYLHYMASGDPVAIARSLRYALQPTSTKFGKSSQPHGSPLDEAALQKAIGHSGEMQVKPGGVVEVDVDRGGKVTMDGQAAPPAFNLQFQAIFEPLGAKRAAITGELPLEASEIQPVAKALTSHGIEVTALHNHETTASPPIFYMHYFAVGNPASLARGVAAALDNAKTQ